MTAYHDARRDGLIAGMEMTLDKLRLIRKHNQDRHNFGGEYFYTLENMILKDIFSIQEEQHLFSLIKDKE